MRNAFHLHGEDPVTPASSGEKRQTDPNGETFYKTPPDCLPQTSGVTKTMESGRNDHSGEQPEETGCLNVLWYLEQDPETEQWH